MFIIFTDLDGTLLDFDTYSYESAEEVLSYIRRQNIPLVAVTSKTAAEVQHFVKAIDIRHPFVVENGCGILFPENYPGEYPKTQLADGYYIVSCENPGLKPLEVLDLIISKTGIPLQSFSRMTPEDIVSLTGLSKEEAQRAQKRHFTEPFILPKRKSDLKKMIIHSHSFNYRIVVGGRFAHLIPKDSGKGKAVKFLIRFYRRLFPGTPIVSVGLGDSTNDYDFLSVTDISVLIHNQGRRQISAPKEWIRSKRLGVKGWAEEVKKIIS